MNTINFQSKILGYSLAIVLLGLVGCGGSGGGGKKSSSSVASSVAVSSVAASSVAVVSSSTGAMSSSSVASSVTPGAWEMVWNDEFDGSNIDSTKWSFEKNCWGGGNNELQCYTDRDLNASIVDGSLVIVARDETFSGQSKPDDDPTYNPADTSVTRDYTSARLRTKNKGDWKYGRIEVRAKLPQGQGIWPAIWMLPTDWEYGGWPYSGEIDIMEAVNSNTGDHGNKIYGTLHFGGVTHRYPGQAFEPEANVWDEYHTYTIEWEEGTIRWYVDSTHYATQISDRWYTENSEAPFAPFDKRFHLILNLAVGGAWPGNPNGETTYPQELSIDYVRVYQCDNDSPDGKGCASDVDPELEPLPGYPKVGGEFASPPLFNMYLDGLASNLTVGRFTPGAVAYSDVDEAGRGKVLNISKTGATGNLYFTLASNSNLSEWAAEGELVFDYKVNSMAGGTTLLVKIDSGWPSVSDASVTPLTIGTWQTFRIGLADLVDNGNSIQSGTANLNNVTNLFVIEPSNTMDISLDNIRLVVE